MASTPPTGLEIRWLTWKDDSFRMTDQTIGWMDTSIPVLTAANGTIIGNSYQTITFNNGNGTPTVGPFTTVASNIRTNGEELTLPLGMIGSGYWAEKDFVVSIPSGLIRLLRLRAKVTGLPQTTTLNVNLLDGTGAVITTVTFSLLQNYYQWYSANVTITTSVAGVQVQCDNSVTIDYIAFAKSAYINQGGSEFDLTIPKKTVSQTIPNSTDIIQQLGITSNSYALTIPKVPYTVYNWLQDRMASASPVEIVTPTKQGTGYILEVDKDTQAGWVGIPIPTGDSLGVTATSQELYDITCTVGKTDNELNIDLTPLPPPSVDLSIPFGGSLPGPWPVFYINGYWFLFFVQNLNSTFPYEPSLSYVSSSGGVWSAPTVVHTASYSAYSSAVYFDGSNVHIAMQDLTNSGNTYTVLYRRGVPQTSGGSAGTITWLQPEQTVYTYTTYTGTPVDFYIAADSNTYPWILYRTNAPVAYVTSMSATTDGTWSTTMTHSFGSGEYGLEPTPLPSGQMLFANSSASGLGVSYWNGSIWQTWLTVGDFGGSTTSQLSSSLNNSNVLRVMFAFAFPAHLTSYLIESVTTANIAQGPVPGTNLDTNIWGVCSDLTHGQVYVFWNESPGPGSYYSRYHITTGQWDTSPTILVPSSQITLQYGPYKAYGNVILIPYFNGTGTLLSTYALTTY